MIFVFHLLDRTDPQTIRADVRPQHKDYLAKIADRIAFAGPLLADDGETMVGSLLAIDFPSRAAAEAWRADEPFTKAGLYETVSILQFRNMVGAEGRLPVLKRRAFVRQGFWRPRLGRRAGFASSPLFTFCQ